MGIGDWQFRTFAYWWPENTCPVSYTYAWHCYAAVRPTVNVLGLIVRPIVIFSLLTQASRPPGNELLLYTYMSMYTKAAIGLWQQQQWSRALFSAAALTMAAATRSTIACCHHQLEKHHLFFQHLNINTKREKQQSNLRYFICKVALHCCVAIAIIVVGVWCDHRRPLAVVVSIVFYFFFLLIVADSDRWSLLIAVYIWL